MARGGIPKDPALRQRRNKTPGAATLTNEQAMRTRAPLMGKRDDGQEWHVKTKKWWRDTWQSPMAGQYIDTDVSGLRLLAQMIDDYTKEPLADKRAKLAAEIRQHRTCFGLTPLDRMRLRWEVEKVEEVTERRQRRRRPEPTEIEDLRSVLKVLS